jgi:PAS domain S-box-containing protein
MSGLGFHLLERGERGVACMGITMAMILLVCFGANAWLTDRAESEVIAATRLAQLNAAGPLLAETAGRLIADRDLSALRRTTAATAVSLKLAGCTVSIGGGRILADLTPARVNTHTLPGQWTVDAADDSSPAADAGPALRYPFSVPGQGAGYVELLTGQPERLAYARFGPSALVCAVGLCVLVLVYRRSRRGLAEMDLIRGSLQAIEAGETSTAALQLDDRLGVTATAWNKLLTEVDGLRRRLKSNTAVAANGNRRAGGNNLEAACDAMSQGLILIDDKMRVRFSNGAACTFLKHDRTSLAGVAATDLVQDEKFQEAIRVIAAGKNRRPITLELEQSGEAGSGVLRFCVRPVRRGDADSAMIIIEDITQQRTAERARNTFINQVTHELRTPLTNIRLYTETAIEDGESNPEVRANCLNVINSESRRLERIVSEMLSVAEIEAGSTMIRREEVYFDALVKELHTDYKAQADEKSIALEFNISPKLPKLEADKDKLTIAIHNLLGNALKYTPQGGKVTVGVDIRDGQLAIDVADTGIGIAAGETEKIFDRFFRSGDPRVGKIVGTGLGLTLAREVMRLHGGDVTVQSEINRGSTFTATMPVTMAA